MVNAINKSQQKPAQRKTRVKIKLPNHFDHDCNLMVKAFCGTLQLWMQKPG